MIKRLKMKADIIHSIENDVKYKNGELAMN